MSTPALDPTTGFLPLGRHRATHTDIHAAFVADIQFAGSSTRAAVWDEYLLGRDLLNSKVRIHSVWIGGSFLTAKLDPQDIDALFIISGRDYKRGDVDAKRVVDSFLPRPNGSGQNVRTHGLTRLDSFLLPWQPYAGFDPFQVPEHTEYAVRRGYWDDWWPRDRFNKPDGKPLSWKDALPQRGYVEVSIDAYDR